ncbi:MAG: hypothetical protein A2202_04890 [Bdellovibrionales bacterium RIFOXYA1_FULL_36_14]|nr:MAG: hypothetical protein A2202_04890 [Bdellovibrionales bacterium RIFOXYA1_FULL_36_14]
MSVEILGGLARGFLVQVPKGDLIRPTSVLLKRRIFDSWQNLEGYIFIDLCAGSGAIGLEALSRGAQKTVFIEKEPSVLKILNNNISKFNERYGEHDFQVLKDDFKKWLPRFIDAYSSWNNSTQENTILFFDPPYEIKEFYDFFVKTVMQGTWFKGYVWIESDQKKGVALDFFEQFKEINIKNYEQGSRYICVFSF